MINIKQCSRCKEEKATNEFYKGKSSKDGLRSYCKKCTKQYYQNNKEKIKEKMREYRQSKKGKETRRIYFQSEKGREIKKRSDKKYHQTKKWKEVKRKADQKYRQGKGIPRIRINGKEKNISRYLMEQEIGRELLPTEIVHHKDGNPFNNTIENLQLCENQLEHMNIHREIRYLRKELGNSENIKRK